VVVFANALNAIDSSFPIWHLLSHYQPDIILWIKVMAIVVFLKGIAKKVIDEK